MPELPEVETVCRGLAKVLPGRSIRAVKLHRDGMRFPFPPALGKLAHVKITGIDRRAIGFTHLLAIGLAQGLLVAGRRRVTQGALPIGQVAAEGGAARLVCPGCR